MNCKDYQELMGEFLDSELLGEFSLALQEHLTGCVHCQREWIKLQQVDQQLRKSLTIPVLPNMIRDQVPWRELAQVLESSDSAEGPRLGQHAWVRTSYAWWVAMVALAASLVLIMWPRDVIMKGNVEAPNFVVGRIRFVTGSVELRHQMSNEWIGLSQDSLQELIAGDRIRTGVGGKCEVETENQSAVRLDESAEVSFDGSDSLALWTGLVWCSTKRSKLQLQLVGNLEQQSNNCICPEDSEIQWDSSTQELVCLHEADSNRIFICDSKRCVLVPSETMCIRLGNSKTPRFVRRNEWGAANKLWQLPLVLMEHESKHDRGISNDFKRLLEVVLQRLDAAEEDVFVEEFSTLLGKESLAKLLEGIVCDSLPVDDQQRRKALQLAVKMEPKLSVATLQALQSNRDTELAELARAALLNCE
ncbi:MAG: zf-HC2 domain-containing protein [Planctomycetales bacterium]|nr:zf-HC2 domain-containing protein [Planctomycetales bacterium]